MTTEEQRNVKVAQMYEELYNSNVERFVRECYTSDCVVYAMGGGTIEGHDQFVHIEKTVLKAAPKRKMRVDRMSATGNVVTVEAVLLNPDAGPDWQIPFCAVLTCRDGKILTDRTYCDYTEWPGLDELR